MGQKKVKKTVLILGVSSFIGSNLAEFLKEDYRVIGTYYQYPVFIPGVLAIRCNILEREALQYIIYNFLPEIIIYSIGLSSVIDCSFDEKYGEALNTSAIFNVTTISERIKSKFCMISSSYIFSGVNKEFTENDTPDPRIVYGRQKAASEFFVQKSCLNYIIFRCCQIYGRSYNPSSYQWFESLQKNLALKKSIPCDGAIKHGFLDVLYLAMLIKMSIEKDVVNRLFHVSSSDTLSYYDFAQKYCEIFHENSSFLQKSNWSFPIIKNEHSYEYTNQEKNFQLKVENIENFLNIRMPTVAESLQFTLTRFGGNNKNVGRKKSRKSGRVQYI